MFWKIFMVFMVLRLVVDFIVSHCRHRDELEDKSGECPYKYRVAKATLTSRGIVQAEDVRKRLRGFSD